jgi:pyruvate ferredoxin oxidoreductase alpha subunit
LIDDLARKFRETFGREAGGLLRTYCAEGADLIVVAMGSISGTIKDVIDEMRTEGVSIGLVTLVTFRPFPTDALVAALARALDVVVIDKALDAGMGGPLASNISIALRGLPRPPKLHSAIVGLGGRAVTKTSLRRLFVEAQVQPWEGPYFLDLNERVVGRELHRRSKTRRVGGVAEAMLMHLEAERTEKLAERAS